MDPDFVPEDNDSSHKDNSQFNDDDQDDTMSNDEVHHLVHDYVPIQNGNSVHDRASAQNVVPTRDDGVIEDNEELLAGRY